MRDHFVRTEIQEFKFGARTPLSTHQIPLSVAVLCVRTSLLTHTEIKLDETLKRRKYFLGFKTRPKLG